MSFAGKLFQSATKLVAEELRNSKSEVHQVVGKHLDQCNVTGCIRFSVGGVCSACSRYACSGHTYLTVAVPPTLMCAECIASEFEVERRKTREKAK